MTDVTCLGSRDVVLLYVCPPFFFFCWGNGCVKPFDQELEIAQRCGVRWPFKFWVDCFLRNTKKLYIFPIYTWLRSDLNASQTTCSHGLTDSIVIAISDKLVLTFPFPYQIRYPHTDFMLILGVHFLHVSTMSENSEKITITISLSPRSYIQMLSD